MSNSEQTANDIEDIYSKLQDQYSREEFEREILHIQEDFGNLIDKEAAALFLAVEKGSYRSEIKSLDRLEDGEHVTVEGKITRVDPLRTFTRKNGSSGQVVSVYLDDGSANVRISFWESRDIERVLGGDFAGGSQLKVVNGRVKINRYGTTVNVGSYSVVKLIP